MVAASSGQRTLKSELDTIKQKATNTICQIRHEYLMRNAATHFHSPYEETIVDILTLDHSPTYFERFRLNSGVTHTTDFNTYPQGYREHYRQPAHVAVYTADSANMASFLENSYSLVHQDNAADVPTMSELRTQLEKGTDESKVETMKRILTIMLNGDPMPQLLMHIIRFVMPSKSKPLKKLLYFYYEICPKLDASGKLKQEMILVWYDLC